MWYVVWINHPTVGIDIMATFTQFKTHRQWSRWGRGAHTLVPKNTFTDLFDISCDIGDFRAHSSCPQMTQELPKKHYDAGLNNCLQMHCHKSITDTVKIGKRLAYAN